MRQWGFVPGVITGVVGVWAWHHFVKPLPAPKKP